MMLPFNMLICLSVCLFPQGSDGARRSTLLDSDEPLACFYDDVKTLYEGFQRGRHVSSKHRTECVGKALNGFHPGAVFLYKGTFAHDFRLLSLIHVSPFQAISSPG